VFYVGLPQFSAMSVLWPSKQVRIIDLSQGTHVPKVAKGISFRRGAMQTFPSKRSRKRWAHQLILI
jgi:hypothetical protein